MRELRQPIRLAKKARSLSQIPQRIDVQQDGTQRLRNTFCVFNPSSRICSTMMRKRPRNRGTRCRKWQRVPGPGGLLRCKKFPRRGPFSAGYQRGHVPDNRGKMCVQRKLVYSPWHDKKVWRCASYGRGSGRRATTLFFKPRKALRPVAAPRATARARRVPKGRVPLSLPSFERLRAGRT